MDCQCGCADKLALRLRPRAARTKSNAFATAWRSRERKGMSCSRAATSRYVLALVRPRHERASKPICLHHALVSGHRRTTSQPAATLRVCAQLANDWAGCLLARCWCIVLLLTLLALATTAWRRQEEATQMLGDSSVALGRNDGRFRADLGTTQMIGRRI